ncbi:hypothetical protein ANCCAN_10569 [Ancylostoma caninum]|uniref:Uncharacterized protein n=1 Tax=Ancylostoma caninum TaxID=29170 RepID=A0A368GGC8_ANCCA|nr:hypothetical protein ANCCAN_10569 [Ancylostoma caninum]
MLKKLDKGDRRRFLHCLNAIADKRDVVSAARCLIEAKESYEAKKKRPPYPEKPRRYIFACCYIST